MGYRYSVHAGVGATGTSYFVYKNQKDHRREKQELGALAEKYGGNLDNSPRTSSYKISITSLGDDE